MPFALVFTVLLHQPRTRCPKLEPAQDNMTNSPPIVVSLGEILWDLFPDGARFGGAPANFANHCASLGAEVWLVSGLGTDELGRAALERLSESGLRLDHVALLDQYPTGQVHVELNRKGEASYQFGRDEAWDHLKWTDELEELAGRCDAVCFGTLGQRHESSRRVIERFVRSTTPGCLRVLDLNLRPPFNDPDIIATSLEWASVLKLNEVELVHLAEHLSLLSQDEPGRLGELAERFGFHAVALTLGERGAVLSRDGVVCHVKSQPVDLRDTVGAGDAFNAVIVLGLVAKADLEQIGRSACRVAEYVCSQQGATPSMPSHLRPAFVTG